VLTALLALFFREPIRDYAEVSFTTADVTQYLSPTTLEPGYTVCNPLLTDPVTQFLPWLDFNRSELAAGRIPLWNPFNGCGAPHFANFQSAVFSPFSLPFYLGSLKFALLVSAFAKLFLASFGLYLFLGRLGLAWLPALIGGSLFAFSGHNALLVSYPHAAVIAWLPFSLLASEIILQRLESQLAGAPARSSAGAWTALVGTLVAAVYSGHPETLCYCVATLACWIVARLLAIRRAARADPIVTARVRGLGARFVGAGMLAAGFGGPQLATFFEYVVRSSAIVDRAASGPTPLDVASWPRYFFADLLGSPAMHDAFAVAQPPPNYEGATLAYVGATALLLLSLALPRVLREARFRVFAVIAGLWAMWAHDLFGLAQWVAHIPLLQHIPIPASSGPWTLSVAACVAFLIDAWLRRDGARNRVEPIAIVVVASAMLGLFAYFGQVFVDDAAHRMSAAPAALAAAKRHIHLISATFVVASAACAVLSGSTSRRIRVAAACVVWVMVLQQTGWLLSFHNTSCADRYVYPVPPQMRRLLDTVGDDRVVVGRNGILACSNLAYRLDQPALYDGLEIRTYTNLYAHTFHAENGWREARQVNLQALSLFGARWLLVRIDPADAAPNSPWLAALAGKNPALRPHGRIGDLELFEFVRSPGRYWLIENWQRAETEEQAFGLVTARTFDASKSVVIGPVKSALADERFDGGGPARGADGEQTSRGSVRIVERGSTRLRLEIANDRPAQLVLTIPWYPGWSATVDGQDAELLRANYAFSAVHVPAGPHTVVLVYSPRSLHIGLALVALSAVLSSALFATGRRRKS
jgi:hypothetical protein